MAPKRGPFTRSNAGFQALVLDLDGTLVADDGAVRPRVGQALADMLQRGFAVQIATGRSEAGTRAIARGLELVLPSIVFNGAALWCHRRDEFLEERVLSNRAVARALAYAEGAGLQVVVMQRGKKFGSLPRNPIEAQALTRLEDLELVSHAELPREYVIRITLFSGAHADPEAFSAEVQKALDLPVYLTEFPLNLLATHRDSPLHVVDIQPPCRGKAEALRYLSEEQGIPPQNVVAVGDAGNDVPMLKAAGLGVAMGEASSGARLAAHRQIGSCNSDAIAELIAEVFR